MPFLSPARDVCVSLYELKQQLMGLNLLAPGASTLIGNILRSVVPPDVEDESLLTEWPGDYVRGCSYEMFFSPSLRIGSQLSGFRFSELAECLYRDAGIILIGLFGTALQDFGASGVAVNPGSHSLTGDEVAIVLARSSEQAVQALRRAPEKITSVQVCTLLQPKRSEHGTRYLSLFSPFSPLLFVPDFPSSSSDVECRAPYEPRAKQ